MPNSRPTATRIPTVNMSASISTWLRRSATETAGLSKNSLSTGISRTRSLTAVLLTVSGTALQSTAEKMTIHGQFHTLTTLKLSL